MKTIIKFRFLLFIQFFFLSNLLMAQMPCKNEGSPIAVGSTDNTANTNKRISIIPTYNADNYTENIANANTIKDFTASLVENEVYVKLIIKGDIIESIYALERSVDGFNYQAISFKNGLPASNKNVEIMYCFKDTKPSDKVSYYRIKQILPNDEKYSDAVIIYKKPEIDLVQKSF